MSVFRYDLHSMPLVMDLRLQLIRLNQFPGLSNFIWKHILFNRTSIGWRKVLDGQQMSHLWSWNYARDALTYFVTKPWTLCVWVEDATRSEGFAVCSIEANLRRTSFIDSKYVRICQTRTTGRTFSWTSSILRSTSMISLFLPDHLCWASKGRKSMQKWERRRFWWSRSRFLTNST